MATPVLLLSRGLDSGGSERQLTEMARSLDRSAWEPHVGCFHDTGIRAQELRAAGVPIVRLPVRSFKSPSLLSGAMQLRAYIRQHRISITHSFDFPANMFSAPVGRLSGCRVLTSQRSHRDLRTPMTRRLLRITDGIADGIVVNCEAVKRHLIADEGVRPEKIHLCYNGIDTGLFRPADDALRPEPLRDAPLVIGTVCVLRPEKGLTTLLEAFAKVRHVRPGTRLAIVGSGPMLAELRQRAAALGIADACWFEPATRDVVSWLRGMDIFVLPSVSEAFSNALMEAMACRCCPVASDQGGNPELVREGLTGMLFRTGDAEHLAERLRLLMESPALSSELAGRAAERMRSEFSVAAAATRLGSIYSAVTLRGHA